VITGLRLKHVASVNAGQSPPSTDVTPYEGEGMPFLQGNAEFGARQPIPVHRCDSAPRIADEKALLVSVRAPVGAVNTADQRYGIGRGLAAINPRSIHPRYAYWLLLSSAERLNSIATGSTFTAISGGDLGNISVPQSDEGVQRAIADYLDRETAQIDALIAKNEELITLLTERLVAEISSALSGVGPEVQLRRLSTVPIQNGVDAIGDPSNPPEWPRYVRTTDIASVSSLNPEKRVTIAPDIAKPGSVEKDDMLMTRAGATIGKSYLHASGEVASYAGYLVRVRPNPGRVLPWYLAYWAQSQEYLDQIRSGAVVSTIENFSASKYRALRVPLPPIAVQADIVDRIRRSVETSNRAIELATTAIDLAWERRAALISAAVTGKIDVGVAA